MQFNDNKVNYGLPSHIKREQIVPGAIVTVEWDDAEPSDCLIINTNPFKAIEWKSGQDCVLTGIGIPDFDRQRFTQTQIKAVKMSPNDVAKAIGMQMPV